MIHLGQCHKKQSGDPWWSKVSLLLSMDGTDDSQTFTDTSPTTKTVTAVGGAKIEADQSVFGGESWYFDGTGDWLTVPDHADFEFGSGDFTIEFWVKTAATNSYACLLTRPSATGFTSGAWAIFFNPGSANGRLVLYVADYSTISPLITASSGDIRDDSWQHVAVTRKGSTWTIWLDGVSVGTGTSSATIAGLSADLYIGQDPNYPGRTYTGYLDELRITKGVARYTAAFDVPASAFPTS